MGAGNPVKFSWTTRQATDWTLTFEGTPVPGFVPSESGTFVARPLASGTFVLSALNAAGDADFLEVPVTVGVPVVDTLKFAATIVGANEPVNLSWTTRGAETLTLVRPDATATPVEVLSLADATGRADISADTFTETALPDDTTYVLTLTNGSGTVTREITVSSTRAVAISAFTVGPSSGTAQSDPLELTAGASIRLDWATVNADALESSRTFRPRPPSSSPRPSSLPSSARDRRPGRCPTSLRRHPHRGRRLRAPGQPGDRAAGLRLRPGERGGQADHHGHELHPRPGQCLAAWLVGAPQLRGEARRPRGAAIGTTVVEESTAATGSFAVTPEATTDYTIVAFNRLGAASSPASVSAYILPPTIQLQVSHQAVVRGAEPVTVSWTTTQTESLQIPGYAGETSFRTPSRTSAPWDRLRT